MSYFTAGPSILMYHSIADSSDEPFTVSVADFRQQLSWLTENGFEVVSLSFLFNAIQARNYDVLCKKVVITFDDGYKDFVTNALPILLDHKAAATVFLVTDMMGGRTSWNESGPDVRLMTEDEVRFIKSRGIGLGSHSVTHANLLRVHKRDLQRQLKESFDSLTRLGESFYAFAYPWGQWSPEVVEAVRSAGYECAVAAGGQLQLSEVNPYLLPRITMRQDLNLKRFRSLLTRTPAEMELRKRIRNVLNKLSVYPNNSPHNVFLNDYVKED